MGEKLPSGWKIIKQHRVSILVVTIIIIVGIALIILGYRFDWTGFNGNNKSGKTLWDWMQLLFIPVVLAVAGFLFNHRERKAAELRADNERKAAELRADNERKAVELHAEAEREIEQQRAKAEQEIERQRAETEREIASDNQREAVLQTYIDKMSELLLHENLRESKPENEVRKIARVRTLRVLSRLDALRKSSVVKFLYESGLINKNKTIIDLKGADLRLVDLHFDDLADANLSGADLRNANLYLTGLISANLSATVLRDTNMLHAVLTEADLYSALLDRANLCKAHLQKANLREAILRDADLTEADLTEADLTGANLKGVTGITVEELKKQAKSLKGATMPDGSIHP